MNQNLLSHVLEFLGRKMRTKRWQRAVTCLAAVAVFGVTYALIMPAITLTGPHPEITAEKLTAWSGDGLTLHVTAEAAEEEHEKIFVLSMDETGADLDEKYDFSEEGTAVIKAKDEAENELELELHRAVRENTKADQVIVDYWFTVDAGTKVEFDLDLLDEMDDTRFSEIVETVKKSAEAEADVETAATASNAEKAAVVTGKEEAAGKAPENGATVSDAAKAETAKASGSNADVAEANAAVKTEEEKIVVEKDDDGFEQILDGAVVNDLSQDEFEAGTVVTAALKVSAGNGQDLEAARQDADRNADKRANAQLKFQWKDYETGGAMLSGELVKNVKDATIAVLYDEDARIPEGAEIDAREIEKGTEEYDIYYAQAVGAVAAGAERDVSTARFFDIKIVDANGNEIEPQAEVKVVITYGKENGTAGNGDLNLLHFHANEEAETVSPQNVIREEDSEALSFTTDRFSVFGCVYTVDFFYVDENGNPYAWSFPGKGSYGLNTVLAEMGINADIEDASLKLLSGQNVEGALYLTSEGGWTLHSDKAFKDTYELTVLAGNKGYKIQVTDAAGDAEDWLSDDWVHIAALELDEEEGGIEDGEGPWDNLDDSKKNGKVRTFDIVKYNLKYRTEMQNGADVDAVKEGYMCFRMILPMSEKEAVWAPDSYMGWIGTQLHSREELEAATQEGGSAQVAKESVYFMYTDADGNQIIEGKKYMSPQGENPNAFPGSGTLNATIQVHMPEKDENTGMSRTIQPTFEMWMDHNDIKNGTCEEHGIEEKKTFTPDPVEVVSELRMNVDLRQVARTYASYVGDFDFDNEGAAGQPNYGIGTVNGASAIYGLTVQIDNRKDGGKGLKGCALPSGPIDLDLAFSAKYKTDGGDVIDLTEMGYTPLVYSYYTNHTVWQLPGRPLPPALANTATSAAPIDTKRGGGADTNTEGSASVWHGGTWTASQNGTTVHFEVDNYRINPDWFPNAISSSRPKEATYWDYTQGVRACDLGCFAAAKVYVVFPRTFKDKDGNVIDILEKWGSGTILSGTDDKNLSAKDTFGRSLPAATDEEGKDNQKETTDDHAAQSVYLTPPGRYSSIIRYNNKWSSTETDTDGTGANIMNGMDTAALGQSISLSWTLNASTNGNKDNMISAAQSLMKFDPNVLDLGDIEGYRHPESKTEIRQQDDSGLVTFLYGAKPDGSAWTDEEEMNACTDADLVYYRSPEEAEAAGMTCVAVLAEWRFPDEVNLENVYSNYQITATHSASVKMDEALTGKAYPIIYYCSFWNMGDMKKLADDGWTLENFPSRIDNPQEWPGIPSNDEMVSDGTIHPSKPNIIHTHFDKAVYENNVFIEDQTSTHFFGDTLYVVSYKATIKKRLKQLNAAGDVHANFDLDTGQRVADYVLNVALTRDYEAAATTATTVTIKDVLPKGLSYIARSAYYGGEYTQTSIGHQGTVSGGQQIEPEIVNNADGGQTLTWVIPNVPIQGTLPDIYYSCDIGELGGSDDVKNGDTLKNTVTVMTTEDMRAPTIQNQKISDEALTVSKTIETSVSKVSDRKFIEATGDPGWTVYVGNNGINSIPNAIMLDTLPVNGDEHGSSFNPRSELEIKEWKIDTSAADNTDTWKAYYTVSTDATNTISSGYIYVKGEDDSYHLEGNPASVKYYDKTKNVEWTEVSIEADGSIPDLVGKKPTAVAVVGTLNAHKTYKAHIVVDPTEDLFTEDKLVNQISRGDDVAQSPVSVVNRALEGIVWLDANHDGLRDLDEEAIQNVPVQLLKLDGNDYVPVKYRKLKENGNPENPDDYDELDAVIMTGRMLDILSGEETDYDLTSDGTEVGRYYFSGLEAGTYAVRFVDDLDTDADKPSEFFLREGTLQNVGDNDMIDSDAATTYYEATENRGDRENIPAEQGKAAECIKQADINGIDMPEIENMASSYYVSPYHDYGIYDALGSLKITKKVTYNGTEISLLSAEDKAKAVYRLAGDYIFGIYEDERCSIPCTEEDGETPRTVTLTIDENLEPVTSVEVTNLKAGDYWIKEVTPANGSLPLVNPVKVTVHASRPDMPDPKPVAVAEFTNNGELTDGPDDPYITLRKVFYGISKDQIPTDFTVTVTDGENTYVLTNKSEDPIAFRELTDKDLIEVDEKACGWQWTIPNVKPGSTYTITENNEIVIGYADPVTTGLVENATVPAAEITFSAAAAVATEDSHLNWPMDSGHWFAASLTNSGGNKGTLIVSRKPLSEAERNAVENGSDGNPSLLSVLRDHDSRVWKTPVYYYSIETHPDGFPINGGMVKYDTDTNEIWFSGTKLWQHTAVVTLLRDITVSDADFTVTNRYAPIETEINVLKVDKNTSQELSGAEFQLYRYTDDTYTTPYDWSSNHETDKWPRKLPVGTDGKLKFEGLTAGYYKLVEVTAPKGYILTDESNAKFEVKVDEEKPKELVVKFDDTNLVTYKAEDKTFTVKNEPGKELPHTGGPGTTLYTLCGLMLLLASALLYGFRRRREERRSA